MHGGKGDAATLTRLHKTAQARWVAVCCEEYNDVLNGSLDLAEAMHACGSVWRVLGLRKLGIFYCTLTLVHKRARI